MEPVSMTLGAIAAVVFAKAQERAAERVVDGGESLMHRFAVLLRGSLADEAAIGALQAVERAPDRPSAVAALAIVLNDRAAVDAEFRTRLSSLVEIVRQDPVAGSFVTEVFGGARVGKIVNINEARDVRL